jgi:transcriptional regulator with XRE-family HTH domain
MLTGMQIRAAKAMLRWSGEDLSERSGVSLSSIRRIESNDGVPTGNVRTLEAIQKALEDGGIEFMGSPVDRPGVRMRIERKPDA